MEISESFESLRPYEVMHFYKYRSANSKGLDELFNSRKLFFADPRTFNDPFECRPNVIGHQSSLKRELYLKNLIKKNFPNVGKKAQRELLSRSKLKMAKNKDFLTEIYDEFIKSFGVYCLSEKRDDILMWSHYSDAHHGLCLEFDASRPETLFWEAFKVTYQEDYPIINVMDLHNTEAFRKVILTKSVHWEYEKEWRIVQTEYEGGSGYHSFSPELLTGVIIGALMQDDDKGKILNWVKNYPTKITVFEAKISRTKYELDIVKSEEL